MTNNTLFKIITLLLSFILFNISPGMTGAQDAVALLFKTSDHGDPAAKAPVVKAWKRVALDPKYSGLWVVTGDVDGDGAVDIVSARNVNVKDVHYTSAAVAQRLDGSIIWQWGNPDIGRREWHHDVACQIHDWDGDGKNEVILSAKGFLVELNGATGKERRRIAIDEEATDCLVFCNLSGNERKGDVLVKDRYDQIWAYNYEGKLLWTVKHPGGYRTAHQPYVIDLDNDGKDELMAGYSMLNSDGSVRWTLSSDKVDLNKGHLDCCRLARKGNRPEDYRFVATYCGAKSIACFDGNGKTLWEVPGSHFESINIGRVFPGLPGFQILVDIDHVPQGESVVWIFDEQGNKRAELASVYNRHHELFDWTGDGLDEIILAHVYGVFDNKGQRIATFQCDTSGEAMQLGDMTGDGIIDIGITTNWSFYIFKNETGRKSEKRVPLGCGVNYTLY